MAELRGKLIKLKAELVASNTRVVSLESSVAALEAELAGLRATAAAAAAEAEAARAAAAAMVAAARAAAAAVEARFERLLVGNGAASSSALPPREPEQMPGDQSAESADQAVANGRVLHSSTRPLFRPS